MYIGKVEFWICEIDKNGVFLINVLRKSALPYMFKTGNDGSLVSNNDSKNTSTTAMEEKFNTGLGQKLHKSTTDFLVWQTNRNQHDNSLMLGMVLGACQGSGGTII